MRSTIYGLFAETSIHPGSGQDTGFVDLPVSRESSTYYPVIAGSSVKGALREQMQNVEAGIFGEQDNAGDLLVSDARLLLLPIRSLQGIFKWVTCPYLLERFMRDSQRALIKPVIFNDIVVSDGSFLGFGSTLQLEERQFENNGDLPENIVAVLSDLIAHESSQKRLSKQLVVLSDSSFAWFAQYGLPVNARNVLDEKTKQSKNLWYEETLAPDSLMYLLLSQRREGAVDVIRRNFAEKPYFRIGGNETIGHGWFIIREFSGGLE